MARQYEVGDKVKLLINDGTEENPNNNYYYGYIVKYAETDDNKYFVSVEGKGQVYEVDSSNIGG